MGRHMRHSDRAACPASQSDGRCDIWTMTPRRGFSNSRLGYISRGVDSIAAKQRIFGSMQGDVVVQRAVLGGIVYENMEPFRGCSRPIRLL